jgi:hypothetical protein
MKKLSNNKRVLVTSFGSLLDCGSDGVYGADDWRDASSPSFAFDADGDLRHHNGSRCYGAVIEFCEGAPDDLSNWPDVDGVFA